jgi:methylated-DNA-[protein]-cysteine S-methyltransferase
MQDIYGLRRYNLKRNLLWKKDERKMKKRMDTIWTGILNESPLGPISYAVSELGLTHVEFGAPVGFRAIEAVQEGKSPVSQPDLLAEISRQLAAYFAGQLQIFDVPVDWGVLSAFQQRALKAALNIPYGQVKSYTRLADDIGQPKASRAVGGAMAGNPMPIIIPCHRVVAADGRLTGYSGFGGLATKAWLLRLEGHQVSGERVISG